MKPYRGKLITQEQYKWFVKNYPILNNGIIAAYLGLSRNQVRRLAERTGVRKSEAYKAECSEYSRQKDKEYTKAWRKAHPEKLREYQRRWNAKNPEKRLGYSRRYEAQNREARNQRQREYRARKRASMPPNNENVL